MKGTRLREQEQLHVTHPVATAFTIDLVRTVFLAVHRTRQVFARRSRTHPKGVHHGKEGMLGVTERCAITALIPPIREEETMSNLPDTITFVRSQTCKPSENRAHMTMNAVGFWTKVR